MSKTQELYDLISAQITGEMLRLQEDQREIEAREKDFLMRQHLKAVRHARFVLETADLEAKRITLLHYLTAENPAGKIVVIRGP